MASEEAAKWRSESLDSRTNMQPNFSMWAVFLNQFICKLQSTIKLVSLFVYSHDQQCNLYSYQSKAAHLTTPDRNTVTQPSTWKIWIVSFFTDFLPQLVAATPKVAGHVTFLWPTYHVIEYQRKLGCTKCYLAFAEKHHKMSGRVVIIRVWRFETLNTLYWCELSSLTATQAEQRVFFTCSCSTISLLQTCEIIRAPLNL